MRNLCSGIQNLFNMKESRKTLRLKKESEVFLVIIPLFIAAIVTTLIWRYSLTAFLALAFIFLFPVLISLLSGILRGLLTKNWSTLRLTFQIIRCNYISEKNIGFKKRLRIVLSKLFWEQPQTYLGNFGMHLINSLWLLKRADVLKNAMVFQGYFFFGGGIALGSYIFIDLKEKKPLNIHPIDDRKTAEKILIRHEYGHYLQSFSSGPLFLFKYGIPSVITQGWTEIDCDLRSDRHLLIEEKIMPVFTYPAKAMPIRAKWFEYLAIIIFTTTGFFINELNGIIGGSLIAMALLSILNLKKPL